LQQREAGSVLVPVKIPESVDFASILHSLVMKAEGAANHRPWKRMWADRYSDEVGKRLEASFFIPATDYVNALQYRTYALEDFLATVLSEVGTLHTAVMPITTPTLEQTPIATALPISTWWSRSRATPGRSISSGCLRSASPADSRPAACRLHSRS
jgi:hypothetical protein